MTLHTAARYGRDPRDLRTPAEMAGLAHSGRDVRTALGAPRARAVFSVLLGVGTWVTAWVLPLTVMIVS